MPQIKVISGLKGHSLNVPISGRRGGAIIDKNVLLMLKPKPSVMPSPMKSASGLESQSQAKTNVEILRDRIKQLNLNASRGSAVSNKKKKYIMF